MNDSVEVTLVALEEAFSRCLYTTDFKMALWTALLGPGLRYDLETRDAAMKVKVESMKRLSEIEDSRAHGLLFATTGGGQWVMSLGQRWTR